MFGKQFAATEDCSWGHFKASYIAGDTSRNPKEKPCVFGTAERDAAKIGEQMGMKKI